MPRKQPTPEPPAVRARVRRGNVADAEQLRADLVQAALELFSSGGLEAVSMRTIAAKVGVGTMTPYRYFTDKAELLTHLWESVLAQLYAYVSRAVNRQRNPRDRHRAWITAYLDYWEKHPEQYRLVYMSATTTMEDPRTGFVSVPTYAALVKKAQDLTVELAQSIGAGLTHAKRAADIRLMMELGYLHGVLVNKRYQWSPKAPLRDAYVDAIVKQVESTLLAGARAPNA
jgi:AcrR family transcriptional regulator